jgi:hypothetical protein
MPEAPKEPKKETYTFSTSNKTPNAKADVLKYPEGKLYTEKTDYVSFEFKKYSPPFAKTTGNLSKNAIETYNSSITDLKPMQGMPRICMYMPEDLGTEYGATWGGKAFTNTGADSLKTAGAFLKGDGKGGFGDAVGSITKNVGNMFQRSEALLADGIATAINNIPGKVGGSVGINDVLGGVGGVILNPNTELLFSGFDLRQFGLNFKMQPNNEKEAKEIRDILTTFKKASLPGFGTDGANFNPFGNKDKPKEGSKTESKHNRNYISLPSLCIIRFMKGSSEHPYLTQYKPCALTNVAISYTPDGQYSTYSDGSPVATTLTLQFTETKLVYRDEIRYGGASL